MLFLTSGQQHQSTEGHKINKIRTLTLDLVLLGNVNPVWRQTHGGAEILLKEWSTFLTISSIRQQQVSSCANVQLTSCVQSQLQCTHRQHHQLQHYTKHTHTHTRTHARTFNRPFSGTTQVGRYQKGKTNLDFTEATAGPYASLHLAPDRQPQQHPTTLFFYRPDAVPATQPTASKQWRQIWHYTTIW